MRKGENAGNQHFLLFPQCFLPIQKKISVFNFHLFCRLHVLSIWTGLNICCLVKGLRTCSFLPLPKINFNFSITSILSSANAFNLDPCKILLFGKELCPFFTDHGSCSLLTHGLILYHTFQSLTPY